MQVQINFLSLVVLLMLLYANYLNSLLLLPSPPLFVDCLGIIKLIFALIPRDKKHCPLS